MKTTLLPFLFFSLTGLFCPAVKAQSLSFSFWDLFGQPSKMRKIGVQQIAQYELYFGALKTGYRVTQEGLNLAHDLKNGTFRLHGAYFNSLEQVNPLIQNSPKGRAIAELDQQIRKLLADELRWQQAQGSMTAAELRYFKNVQDNLLAKCRLDMNELPELLTPGKLQLSDAQRLSRLDKLYESMKDKYAFAGAFTARCRKLALARKQNRQDKEEVKKLYGIQ